MMFKRSHFHPKPRGKGRIESSAGTLDNNRRKFFSKGLELLVKLSNWSNRRRKLNQYVRYIKIIWSILSFVVKSDFHVGILALVMSARLMSNLALGARPNGIPTLRAVRIVKTRVRRPKAKPQECICIHFLLFEHISHVKIIWPGSGQDRIIGTIYTFP